MIRSSKKEDSASLTNIVKCANYNNKICNVWGDATQLQITKRKFRNLNVVMLSRYERGDAHTVNSNDGSAEFIKKDDACVSRRKIIG